MLELEVELTPPIPRPRDQQLDLAAGGEHQPGQRFVVQRVAGGAEQGLASFAKRKEPRPAQEVGGDAQAVGIKVEGVLLRLPHVAAQHVRVGLGQVIVRQGA